MLSERQHVGLDCRQLDAEFTNTTFATKKKLFCDALWTGSGIYRIIGAVFDSTSNPPRMTQEMSFSQSPQKMSSFLVSKSSCSVFLIDSLWSRAACWHDTRDDEVGRATLLCSGSSNNKHLLMSTARQRKGNHVQKDLSAYCSLLFHDSSKAIPIAEF